MHIVLCFSSYCVPYVASFSGLPFLIGPSLFRNVYLWIRHKEWCNDRKQNKLYCSYIAVLRPKWVCAKLQ